VADADRAEELIAEGYRFAGILPGGRVVLERPDQDPQ